MEITITARHFDLTKAIRDYIEESCEKLKRYFDHIINVHFVLSLENNRNYAEMILYAPKHTMKSEATEHDMYLAIDDAIGKMESQIKKLKDKWADHQKRSLKENTQFFYTNLIHKDEPQVTVTTKKIAAEVMSINDAITRFEENKNPYFIFKNIETDRVNVLVKKDDYHYKLLEP